jgi:hypothetical protein
MIQQSLGTHEKRDEFADSGKMLVIMFSDVEEHVKKIIRLLVTSVCADHLPTVVMIASPPLWLNCTQIGNRWLIPDVARIQH